MQLVPKWGQGQMAQFLTFILNPVSGGAGQLEPKYKAEIQLTAEELIEIADKLEGGKRQPGNSMTVFDPAPNLPSLNK